MEEKKMYEGSWKCSKCRTDITQLPFEPNEDKLESLKCFDCFKEDRPQRSNKERRMYSGNWKCSGCGKDITELPFEPKSEENLKCRECFVASR